MATSTLGVVELRKQIGARLRQLRERLKLSQPEFAERLGVYKLSVFNYENGATSLGVDQLETLERMNVDAMYVAFGVPSPDTAEGSAQFAASLSWVREICRITSLKVEDKDLVKVAWYVYKKVAMKHAMLSIPSEADMRATVERAVKDLLLQNE